MFHNPTGIEQNPKLGYYKVADQIFYSKPAAYIYGTQHKILPTWNFNDVEYARHDWTQEPETDLRELYKQRALQIREKYDYIILNCSGGADSTTTAFSFLLNGIHLDEIVFKYPKIGEKDQAGDPWDTRCENTLSEWNFAGKPLFDWIKINYPNTKLRLHDFGEKMLEQQNTRDESWIFQTQNYFQPTHADKHDNFYIDDHVKLYDSGKKICLLYGIDKPKIAIVDDQWYCYFQDTPANYANPYVGSYSNLTTELFFWTPDLPQISIKQAHVIRHWFTLPENRHLQYLILHAFKNPIQRTAYESVIKPIIYPDYDPITWQTAKSVKGFDCEMDQWFFTNFKDTRLFNVWEAGIELLIDKIDPTYFSYQMGKPFGLSNCLSKFYHIGDNTCANDPVFLNRSHSLSFGPYIAIQDKKLKKISL